MPFGAVAPKNLGENTSLSEVRLCKKESSKHTALERTRTQQTCVGLEKIAGVQIEDIRQEKMQKKCVQRFSSSSPHLPVRPCQDSGNLCMPLAKELRCVNLSVCLLVLGACCQRLLLSIPLSPPIEG